MINADAYPLLITCWKDLSLESRISDERQKTIRRVMMGYWIFHIIVTGILTAFVVVDKYPSLMSTFLIILQLYIIKIFESLNGMYSKVMTVEMVSTPLVEYMQEKFFKCLEKKREYIHSVEHVSSDILHDLRYFEKEMKWYTLVLSSLLWKVPKHSKFITEKDVSKESFENVLNGGTYILNKNIDIF
jgi:hypothetical protein